LWIWKSCIEDENAQLIRYRSVSFNPIDGNNKCKYLLIIFLVDRKIMSGIKVNKIVEGEKYRSNISRMIPEVKFVGSGNNVRKLSDIARGAISVWAIKVQYIKNRSTMRIKRNLPADLLTINS
jgi:hypothetical protein